MKNSNSHTETKNINNKGKGLENNKHTDVKTFKPMHMLKDYE